MDIVNIFITHLETRSNESYFQESIPKSIIKLFLKIRKINPSLASSIDGIISRYCIINIRKNVEDDEELTIIFDKLDSFLNNYKTKTMISAFYHPSTIDLKMTRDYLVDIGFKCFIQDLPGSRLKILDLSDSHLIYTGMKSLVQILPQTQISTLNLSGNQIRDRGMISLAQILPQTQISTLNLSGDRITNERVEILTPILPETQITNLNMARNLIDNEGAIALAKVLPKTSIQKLNLSSNHILDRGSMEIIKIFHSSQLVDLNLCHNKRGLKFCSFGRVTKESLDSKIGTG